MLTVLSVIVKLVLFIIITLILLIVIITLAVDCPCYMSSADYPYSLVLLPNVIKTLSYRLFYIGPADCHYYIMLAVIIQQLLLKILLHNSWWLSLLCTSKSNKLSILIKLVLLIFIISLILLNVVIYTYTIVIMTGVNTLVLLCDKAITSYLSSMAHVTISNITEQKIYFSLLFDYFINDIKWKKIFSKTFIFQKIFFDTYSVQTWAKFNKIFINYNETTFSCKVLREVSRIWLTRFYEWTIIFSYYKGISGWWNHDLTMSAYMKDNLLKVCLQLCVLRINPKRQ